MNTKEFSAQFDVLFNNITSNQAPGLNEFEKTVFLTKAQSQLINEYFNIRTDGIGGGFDGSQRRQYDFSSLILTEELDIIEGTEIDHIDERSKIVEFPEKYFLSVNEAVKDGTYQYSVIPLSYAEYQRLMLKPYAFPVKKAVWRLINSKSPNGKVYAELIGKFNADNAKFVIRYIQKPTPIILEDLHALYGEDITVEGEWRETPCILPEETHQEILERAVTLAKIAWQGGTMTQAAAQQNNSK